MSSVRDDAPSVLPTLLASSTASAMARIPCHPLDTIKARLQVQGKGGRLADGSAGYSGMWACLRGILQGEGAAGLYRGIGITLPGSMPAGCLYFTSYELCNSRLREALPRYPVTASLTAGAGDTCQRPTCSLRTLVGLGS